MAPTPARTRLFSVPRHKMEDALGYGVAAWDSDARGGGAELDRWIDAGLERDAGAAEESVVRIDPGFYSELFGGVQGGGAELVSDRSTVRALVVTEKEARRELCHREVCFRGALLCYVEAALLYRYCCQALLRLYGAGLSSYVISVMAWGNAKDASARILKFLDCLREGARSERTARFCVFYKDWLRCPNVPVLRVGNGQNGVLFLSVSAADAACEGESDRFLLAIESLLCSGLTLAEIAVMAGYSGKIQHADSIRRLYCNVRRGSKLPSAEGHLESFNAAYGEWLASRGAAAELRTEEATSAAQGVCQLGLGKGLLGSQYGVEIAEHLEGPMELRMGADTVVWCVAAVDRLRDCGTSYGTIATMLGYASPSNGKREVEKFLTVTSGIENRAERLDIFRTALARWELGGSGAPYLKLCAALDRLEDGSRAALALEEEESLYNILLVLAEIRGFAQVWIPVLIGRALKLGVSILKINLLAGYSGVNRTKSIKALLRSLKRPSRADVERAEVAGAGLIALLSRPEYSEPLQECSWNIVMTKNRAATKVRARAEAHEERSWAARNALAFQEAERRTVLVGGEELCRSSLELALVRLHPTTWFLRAVGRMVSAGLGPQDISAVVGRPYARPGRGLAGNDLQVAWRAVKSWERRQDGALVAAVRGVEGAEAEARKRIVEEERAGLDLVVRPLMDVPGLEPLWIPHAAEALLAKGYSAHVVEKLAGYCRNSGPEALGKFLASLKGGPEAYGRRAAIFKERLLGLEAGGSRK